MLSSMRGTGQVSHVLLCDGLFHIAHMGLCLCSRGAHIPPISHFPIAIAACMIDVCP